MKKYIVDTDVLIGFNDSLPMDVYETQWKKIGDELGQAIGCVNTHAFYKNENWKF